MKTDTADLQERMPKPLERYQHFRGGRYQVLTLAEKEDTGEQLVVYQALYGDNKIYARSLASFVEELSPAQYPDAVQRFRFQKIEEERSGEAPSQDLTSQDSAGCDAQDLASQDGAGCDAQDLASQDGAGCDAQDLASQDGAGCDAQDLASQDGAGSHVQERTQEASESLREDAAPDELRKTVSDEEDPSLDPMLERFLDARTTQDRLTVLDEMRGRVTDAMIDTMALASDVEVKPGPLQLRYEDLHDCLLTIQRYELERSRLRG